MGRVILPSQVVYLKQKNMDYKKLEAAAPRRLTAEIEAPQDLILPPPSHKDGVTTWPENPSLSFDKTLKEAKEKEAFVLCAIDGITPTDYAHLLPQSSDASNTPVHNGTVEPVRKQRVPLQTAFLVNTTTNDRRCPEDASVEKLRRPPTPGTDI